LRTAALFAFNGQVNITTNSLAFAASLISLLLSVAITLAGSVGPFEGQTDIGKPARVGSARLDPDSGTLTIAGGGGNMWFTSDSFHFIWAKVSGDFVLSSGIGWLGSGGNAHRKACLIVRQDLTPGSAYIDVAVHGDGLTSLQFRETAGGMTREIQLPQKQPGRVGLERQGDTFIARVPGSDPGGKLVPAGAFMRMAFSGPVYVGLGVCAHDDAALEAAKFTAVALERKTGASGTPVLHSSLETIAIGSKDRKVVHTLSGHFEAPNWSGDGSFFIFNSGGRLLRLPTVGGKPVEIDTGFAIKCNNDHGLSPDGKQLVVSDQTRTGKSLIYTLPVAGGEPRQVTDLGPSYWHGWSPDGKTLAYCAERNGEYDVYTIPAAGGAERRLTTAKGLDDGPEYTADGKFIYFNSDRTGTMHIWRMRPDGSGQEQVTTDDFNNWFAHPSPDGKWIVFLSYDKDVQGHPANKNVRLRLQPIGGGPIQELAHLFGGQGTINVPSWSPDSRNVAFVSYELIGP
jgi:hypothetical protein